MLVPARRPISTKETLLPEGIDKTMLGVEHVTFWQQEIRLECCT